MKRAILMSLAVALAVSCGKGPTDPSDNVTQSFSGTIVLGQPSPIHTFHASNEGEIFVSLGTMTPPLLTGKFAVLVLGVASGSNCSQIRSSAAVPGTTSAVVTASVNDGDYCAAVLDPGGSVAFTSNEDYSITVSHP